MTLTPEQSDDDELRELLANWQAAKRRAWNFAIRAMIVLLLVAIAVSIAISNGA